MLAMLPNVTIMNFTIDKIKILRLSLLGMGIV